MSSNGKMHFGSRRKTISVYIPELDTTLHLRAMSFNQARELRSMPGDPADPIKQLWFCLVDENGNRTHTTEDDLRDLAEMSVMVFDPLMKAINEIHGGTEAATEEILKN